MVEDPIVKRISALLVMVAATAVATLGQTTPAEAATTDFHGVNWADERDNFVDGVLVLGGLSLLRRRPRHGR
jgi:hypothetical protein